MSASKFMKIHGTTLTIGLFLVSTISGVALFFHIQSSAFHAMHEWLSMVLLVPVVVHIWRNWAAFANYFRQKTIWIPLALSIAISVPFAWPALSGSQSGGNPFRAGVRALQSGSISQVAPLYDMTPAALAERLKAKGYNVTSVDLPLIEVAKASGKSGGPSLIADVSFPVEKAE